MREGNKAPDNPTLIKLDTISKNCRVDFVLHEF